MSDSLKRQFWQPYLSTLVPKRHRLSLLIAMILIFLSVKLILLNLENLGYPFTGGAVNRPHWLFWMVIDAICGIVVLGIAYCILEFFYNDARPQSGSDRFQFQLSTAIIVSVLIAVTMLLNFSMVHGSRCD